MSPHIANESYGNTFPKLRDNPLLAIFHPVLHLRKPIDRYHKLHWDHDCLGKIKIKTLKRNKEAVSKTSSIVAEKKIPFIIKSLLFRTPCPLGYTMIAIDSNS